MLTRVARTRNTRLRSSTCTRRICVSPFSGRRSVITNPDITTVPYFNLFTFPKNGEAGGVPSGTEKYYSFDYGRIHFIALDSMTSSRAPGSPMLTWLQSDLASTTQD